MMNFFNNTWVKHIVAPTLLVALFFAAKALGLGIAENPWVSRTVYALIFTVILLIWTQSMSAAVFYFVATLRIGYIEMNAALMISAVMLILITVGFSYIPTTKATFLKGLLFVVAALFLALGFGEATQLVAGNLPQEGVKFVPKPF